MPSVARQIADIERELLALTSDQPLNPSQITTFKVTRTSAVSNEVKTLVFDDGIARFTKLFNIGSAANAAYLYYDAGSLKVLAAGSPGAVYTLVSLGAFTLV